MTETKATLERSRQVRREYRREASGKVIDAYRCLERAIGSWAAMDYAKITGGQGAQYAKEKGGSMFTAIDYVADVLRAVKETLEGSELRWYLDMLDSDRDHEHSTPDQDRIHVLVARTYIERGLFPVTRYFTPSQGH